MGPGNMGAPIGGVVVLLLVAGCVVQVIVVTITLLMLVVLRRYQRARRLIPIALVGIPLSVPITIGTLWLLQSAGQTAKVILDSQFVAIWMSVSAALSWLMGAAVVTLIRSLKDKFINQPTDESKL